MKIFNAICVALGLFALIKFPLLSLAQKSWAKRELIQRRKKGWWIAILEQAADLCLTAAITFSLVALIMLLIGVVGGNTLTQAKITLVILDSLRKPLALIEGWFSSFILLLSVVIFSVLWLRTGKQHFETKFDALVEQQVRDLERTLRESPGGWKQLEPTTAMRKVADARELLIREEESIGHGCWDYEQRSSALQEKRKKLEIIFVNLDLERRIDFPWQSPALPAQTVQQHLAGIVLSRGFLSDIKKAGKALKYATVALTFAGLLAFQGSGMVQAVDAKIAKVDALRVSNSLEESARLRKATIRTSEEQASAVSTAQPSVPTPLTAKQREALRAFAHASLRAFARNPTWPQATADASPDLRRAAVRLAVLEQTQLPPRVAPARLDEPASEESVAFDSYAETSAHPETLSKAEDAVIEDIDALPRNTRSRVVAGIVTWFEKRYEGMGTLAPVDASELQGTFVENFISAMIPDAPAFTGELGKHFREVVSAGAETATRNAFEIARNLIVLRSLNQEPENVIESLPREDLFAFLTRAESKTLRPFVSIYGDHTTSDDDLLQDAQRRIARVNPQSMDDDKPAAILKSFPEELRKGRETGLANLLSDFEGEFPQQGTVPSSLARESVLSSWGIVDNNGVEIRAARALSFDVLQSYSRVGGILFGREPNGEKLDVPGFWWEDNRDVITLHLRPRGSDSAFTIDGLRPYLVWQALAYAADQRPTVVTLLTASTLGGGLRQVMVHPAFRDTALGCRLLQADRWIFHYTDPDPKNSSPTVVRKRLDDLELATNLYASAWDAMQSDETENPYSNSKPLARYLHPEDIEADTKLPGIQPELMRIAEECAIFQQNEFPNCVRTKSEAAPWKPQLPKIRPQFGFVSQIREAPYSGRPDLEFLRELPATINGAPPLELTVQMTINDTSHWEFPDFATGGLTLVMQGLIADGKSADLRELQDLARLQRLFRGAIQGYMGSSFPIEKFTALAARAKLIDSEPAMSTPRWLKERGEDKTPEADLADDLQNAMAPTSRAVVPLSSEMHQRLMSKVDSCVGFLRNRSNEARPKDMLAKICHWQELEQDVRDECTDEVSGGAQPQDVAACRIFVDSKWGEEEVGALHSLRLSLWAANASFADDLRCPSVHH